MDPNTLYLIAAAVGGWVIRHWFPNLVPMIPPNTPTPPPVDPTKPVDPQAILADVLKAIDELKLLMSVLLKK